MIALSVFAESHPLPPLVAQRGRNVKPAGVSVGVPGSGVPLVTNPHACGFSAGHPVVEPLGRLIWSDPNTVDGVYWASVCSLVGPDPFPGGPGGGAPGPPWLLPTVYFHVATGRRRRKFPALSPMCKKLFCGAVGVARAGEIASGNWICNKSLWLGCLSRDRRHAPTAQKRDWLLAHSRG